MNSVKEEQAPGKDASHGGNGEDAVRPVGTTDEAPSKGKAPKVRYWLIYSVALLVYLACMVIIVVGSR